MKILATLPLDQQVESEHNCRFLYPESTWIWLQGYNVPAGRVDSLRPKLSKDLLTLNQISRKSRQATTVVLDMNDPMADTASRVVPYLEGWNLVSVGVPPLLVKNPRRICGESANFVLRYGPEPDWWEEFDPDNVLDVVERSIELPPKTSQNLQKIANPYADYESLVENIRRWWREPYFGVKIRDEIDLRPKSGMTWYNH